MNRSLILLCVLAACGDNAKLEPDGGGGDNGDSGGSNAAPLYKAVMLGADFSSGTGVVSRLDLATLEMQTNAIAGVATSDPVVRHIGDKLYVVNRFVGENVTILDAHSLSPIDQISTGASSNPQDVAVVGEKLYVPAMGTTGVVVLDNGHATTIDLGSVLGDPDGKPDCVSAYAVGTKVFVACSLLDQNFTPRGPGKIAVIDTATDHATALTMPDKNPAGFFTKSPDDSVFHGDLLISLVPSFDTYTTGCLLRVPTDGTTAPTCATGVSNMALGGFINSIAVGTDKKLYLAVVVDANFSTQSGKLRTFDMNAGTLVPTVMSSMSEQITDLAACPDGEIVAIDSTMNANGVRVFKDGTERTTMPLSIGLPPIFGSGIVCYDANHP
ncbi:MAG: hypothetical protein JO257_19160 [Deltaproteobacteria bacterium]|nr:hypothetical protein [Deltaproteobacteria bacterium]